MKLGDVFRFAYDTEHEGAHEVFMRIWARADRWRYVSLETGQTWTGEINGREIMKTKYYEENKYLLDAELIIYGEKL
jgi:hypothetical protein